MPSSCNCEYDAVGDPLQYERCLPKCCPVHDMCSDCGERLGVVLVPQGEYRTAWICQECHEPELPAEAYYPNDLRDFGAHGDAQ
jgi:hypothetical protein